MAKQITTLCILHERPWVLLAMKKRGFGKGRWNGFGGKVQKGESIEAAAKRELFEESGLKGDILEKTGVLNFAFAADGTEIETHVFRVVSYSGELIESEEMRPQWFDESAIPFHDMWPDDLHWLPLFLERKVFRGRFLFGDGDEILEQEIKEE